MVYECGAPPVCVEIRVQPLTASDSAMATTKVRMERSVCLCRANEDQAC